MGRRIKQSIEDRSRLEHPKMEGYRRVYSQSREYRGTDDLCGKVVIVYGEQGYGDIIQFARYIPDLMGRGCRVIVQCPIPLHRLFRSSGIGHEWINRDGEALPDHDYHIPMMSLPFLKFREKPCPYLFVATEDVFRDDEFNIGIAWEGNPDHTNNSLRSCPLSSFSEINSLPGTRTYMLQQRINLPEYAEVDDDFRLYSTPRADFYDTACLICGMNMVISVDTSVLHLAGALGVPDIYGLLATPSDYRWQVRQWYPSITFMRDHQGDWGENFNLLKVIAANQGMVKVSSHPIERIGTSILVTGGIGDFLALESHMRDNQKKSIVKVYLATRANAAIKTLITLLGWKAEVLEIFAEYSKVTFYQKSEVSMHLREIGCPYPGDWSQVEDWSILVKFPEIKQGKYSYVGSGIFEAVPSPPVGGEYVIICPMTETDADRKLGRRDWDEIVRYLVSRQIQGVVLAGKKVGCPDHPLLTNISGETTMLESIACLKGASGYFGVDSFLSVLSAQRFEASEMKVKSHNNHLYRNGDIYYAPHRDRSFIAPDF